MELGYKGVCIAAGGAMALRFVKEHSSQGIVAVACDKELEEGIEAVEKTVQDGMEMPVVEIVPLLSDGCVDTEVDEELLLKTIASDYCSGAGVYSSLEEAVSSMKIRGEVIEPDPLIAAEYSPSSMREGPLLPSDSRS